MKNVEGDLGRADGANEEDQLDPDDVQQPGQDDPGGKPPESSPDRSTQDREERESDEPEADNAVRTRARRCDGDWNRVAAATDEEQAVASADGRREGSHGGDHGEDGDRPVDRQVRAVRQDRKIWRGPGEKEEEDREPDVPKLAHPEQECHDARDEQWQAEKVDAQQPEVESRGSRHDDADEDRHSDEHGSEQPTESEVEAQVIGSARRPARGPVPAQAERDDRDEPEIREGRLQREPARQGKQRIVVCGDGCGDQDERTQRHGLDEGSGRAGDDGSGHGHFTRAVMPSGSGRSASRSCKPARASPRRLSASLGGQRSAGRRPSPDHESGGEAAGEQKKAEHGHLGDDRAALVLERA